MNPSRRWFESGQDATHLGAPHSWAPDRAHPPPQCAGRDFKRTPRYRVPRTSASPRSSAAPPRFADVSAGSCRNRRRGAGSRRRPGGRRRPAARSCSGRRELAPVLAPPSTTAAAAGRARGRSAGSRGCRSPYGGRCSCGATPVASAIAAVAALEVVEHRGRLAGRVRPVQVAVQPDRVAPVDDPARQLRALDDLLADQEEGRPGVVLGEDLEHPGRALGVGAVVEGDRHSACGLLAGRSRVSQPVATLATGVLAVANVTQRRGGSQAHARTAGRA